MAGQEQELGVFFDTIVVCTVTGSTHAGMIAGFAALEDPVYEGKSMAGLINLVSQGEIAKDSTVLYAHLGGQPALNAYSGIFG